MKQIVFIVVTSLACLAACSGSNGDSERQKLLLSWGDHVILPLYRDFEAKAAAVRDSSNALCDNPSNATLQAAQSAWWDARAPWKQIEVFAFGPYTDEPLRLGPKIDFWPVRVEAIEQILFDTTPIASDILGATQKGLPVIEYLLYQPDFDVVTNFSEFPRRCEYLMAITEDLAARALEMREAWDPEHGNYLAELVDAGHSGSTFETLHLALSEVVNRMAFTIEDIRAEKLGDPLGTSTGGSPQPGKAESQFSGRSIADIHDNLQGIELLYFGDGSIDSIGLDSYAHGRGYDFTQAMRDRLAAARGALEQISGPLTQAVLDQPAGISEAIDRLGDLQRLLQVDILNALSLIPGFNDNDGD